MLNIDEKKTKQYHNKDNAPANQSSVSERKIENQVNEIAGDPDFLKIASIIKDIEKDKD